MSLAFSDLSTTTTTTNDTSFSILQATRSQDKTEISETVAITYQILLLTYQANTIPSLADVLHSHKQYFITNHYHQDQDERTYQYILDLSLSSEQDWWSKLEVESKQSKTAHRAKGFHHSHHHNNNSNSNSNSDSDFNAEDSATVSPLLSWAAICWLETSFASRTCHVPEQIVSCESKQDLVDFQAQYPGLSSQMQLQGRQTHQPHWWTGRSSGGLSLYLSSAAVLHKFQLHQIFKKWERAAALQQFQRYKHHKLAHIFTLRYLHGSFDSWKQVCQVEKCLDQFVVHRYFRYWKVWLNKLTLREPFVGWAVGTRRWKKKLIAFQYWCGLAFVQQKKTYFHCWSEYIRLDRLGGCFVHWSNVADSAWENRHRFKLAVASAVTIRRFRIQMWVFNGWNTYMEFVHRYREGAQHLFYIARKKARQRLSRAMESWYHAYMVDVHSKHGVLTKNLSQAQLVAQTLDYSHIDNQMIRNNHIRLLGCYWDKWVHLMVVSENQHLLRETAVSHAVERLVVHAFYTWHLVVVEKRRALRQETVAEQFRFQRACKPVFFGFVVNLILARQEKIKTLEAAMHCRRTVLEKLFLRWVKLRFCVSDQDEGEK